MTATSDRSINIPHASYLGFSAETGELSDNHDILTINSYSLYNQTPESQSKSPVDTRRQQTTSREAADTKDLDNGGGGSSFIFKLLLFVILVGGSYVGWTIYRTSRWGSRF